MLDLTLYTTVQMVQQQTRFREQRALHRSVVNHSSHHQQDSDKMQVSAMVTLSDKGLVNILCELSSTRGSGKGDASTHKNGRGAKSSVAMIFEQNI